LGAERRSGEHALRRTPSKRVLGASVVEKSVVQHYERFPELVLLWGVFGEQKFCFWLELPKDN